MLGFRRGYAALLRDATAYVVAGQFPAAIRILEQLRRDRPDDLVLMAHLGQVYVAAGRDDDAVPLLEHVVSREPDRFEAYVDLATGYMHQGDLARARAAVERAVSLNRSYGPAYETPGGLLARSVTTRRRRGVRRGRASGSSQRARAGVAGDGAHQCRPIA